MPDWRAIALLAAGAALAACAGTPGVTRHDDGSLSIECSGGYHDWSQCYRRAEDVCGGAFDIVSRVTDEGSGGVGTRDWSAQGSEVKRTLIVRCGG